MRLPPQKQAIEQHCRNTDANRAVGNIESRPMQVSSMEIEKINDCSEANPVNDIADGATDDQPDRDR